MAIQKTGIKHNKSSRRKAPKSQNAYLALLVKLYRFLARRTESNFNAVVLRRLYASRVNRPSMSLSKLAKFVEGKEATAVLVGTVTDDVRMVDVPKVTVCALHVTKTARARIVAAGGEVLTFDQLAIRAPTGKNTLLLRGKTSTREANKYFSPGAGSHAKPITLSKGRKFEKARGRRHSRGFKIKG
ncbi:50S ribosomal protein L18e [Fonticula alba]|uniref:50S ribosomal protein L18e n=1 Tax=Fonticula alba TaxID=691883 RepID=A0A058Z1B6_FONAL|nr:50S ribosomal protein L18e [Fonticula alba]KCV67733.1 50S ribosomal protein L18e [Fonticula alba]|eukprot:XP_009497917.1 50S ribosomal protein L18e [Fonticula alba]